MSEVIIDGAKVPVSETKTVMSFKAPTPPWANLMFNIVFVVAALVTTAVMSFFNSYISTEKQLLIVTVCSFTTYAVRFISKSFGLEIKE